MCLITNYAVSGMRIPVTRSMSLKIPVLHNSYWLLMELPCDPLEFYVACFTPRQAGLRQLYYYRLSKKEVTLEQGTVGTFIIYPVPWKRNHKEKTLKHIPEKLKNHKGDHRKLKDHSSHTTPPVHHQPDLNFEVQLKRHRFQGN